MDVLTRYFVKEEEFLAQFETVATVAAWFLHGDWAPDYHCNDAVRRTRDKLLASGALAALVFSGAAVYHSEGSFASVQIALRSTTRSVNLRVKKIGHEFVAEKLADRPVSVQG